MKKLALVIQQYGREMYGGAEFHCMRLAEGLTSFYQVEVLTTCSLDFLSWADHYPEGVSDINGVTVRRFRVSQLRDWKKMEELEKKVKVQKADPVKKRSIKSLFKKLVFWKRNKKASLADYSGWILAQGPATPDLIDYIRTHEKEYDCLIFFSYLYYPTFFGVGIQPEKTILVPLAHEEWAVYMPVFKSVFTRPACIMYNTEAEKKLVNRISGNQSVYSEIAGIWVNVPGELPEQDMKTEMKIYSDYVLYVGRIDDNKLPSEDLQWFLKYVEETKKDIKLVLTGNLYRELPVSNHILYLGFVTETAKFNLIRQSLFLFQPSRFESLSMVVLEAFSMEKPVLVHEYCEVMRDHVDKSNGGLYYHDYPGFKKAFDKLSGDQRLNAAAGISGKKYVDSNYLEDIIVGKYRHVIENRISNQKK